MQFSLTAFAASIVLSSAFAFTPTNVKTPLSTKIFSTVEDVDEVVEKAVADGTFARGPIIVDKPTGTSFLPEETVERCEKGNPTEKVKLANDPIHAWVDIYEYARKIREGEMTWEEVDKADLDTVSFHALNSNSILSYFWWEGVQFVSCATCIPNISQILGILFNDPL